MPNQQPPWMTGNNDKLYFWTNAWAIGVVMYELTTLHRAARVLFGRPDPEGHGCPPILTNKAPEYSTALRDTIRSCLNMTPDDRMSIIQLRIITRRYARLTKDELAAHRPAPDVPCEEERLYYRDNEINGMAPGGDYIPSRVHEQIRRESGFWNPDVSVLRYPNFTPFEDSDDAGDDDLDGVEMEEEEEEEGGRDEEGEGEGRELGQSSRYPMRYQVHQSTNEDEDGQMEVDEPTVVPGRDGETETVRPHRERPAADRRFDGMNRFGRPRMGY